MNMWCFEIVARVEIFVLKETFSPPSHLFYGVPEAFQLHWINVWGWYQMLFIALSSPLLLEI